MQYTCTANTTRSVRRAVGIDSSPSTWAKPNKVVPRRDRAALPRRARATRSREQGAGDAGAIKRGSRGKDSRDG
jgi:hypothetical protein